MCNTKHIVFILAALLLAACGSTAKITKPVEVSALPDVVQVAAGEWHTCARVADGQVFCWGFNLNGTLGDGTTADKLVPNNPVQTLWNATQLTAGERHNCVLTEDRDVLCWGYNGAGQLGNGTAADAVAPVRTSLDCQ